MRDSGMLDDKDDLEFEWITREMPGILHNSFIVFGGSGEVHKVGLRTLTD